MPEHPVLTAAARFRAQVLSREREAANRLVQTYGRAYTRLAPAIESLSQRIARMDAPGPSRASLVRLESLRSLQFQVVSELNTFSTYADTEISRAATAAIQSGLLDSRALSLAAMGGTGPGARALAAGWDMLPTESVETMLGFLADDSPLHTALVNKLGPAVAQRMSDALVDGIALGMNPRKVADIVRRELGVGLTWALTTARTAQINAYREAARANYVANSHIVQNWVWLSALDGRVCLSCLNMHGSVHPLTENLNGHHSCRCVPIPSVRQAAAFGLPQPEIEPGEQWFKRQSEDFQRQRLGPGRFDAWKAGKFDFRDLSQPYNDPVYGEMLREATLKGLLTGKAKGKTLTFGTPAPEKMISAPLVYDDNFPIDLARLEDKGRLGGSTGARLVQDPITGKRYVLKKGASPEHIRQEFLADELYRAMGVKVPKARLYEVDGVPTKLAEFVDGARSLADLKRLDKKAYNKAVAALKKDFAADAYLGNWDVIGQAADNVLIDSAGDVWRIDNGGSLFFRAQGGVKAQWGQYVDEFWSMRNPKINPQTADVFGDLTYGDTVKSMKNVVKSRAEIEALVNASTLTDKALLLKRLDSVEDLIQIEKTLRLDSWNDSYIESFSRHVAGLRNDGIIDKLPKKLTNKGVEVFDENGKRWDNLRGYDDQTIVGDLSRYMNKTGGDYKFISYWEERQSGDSWSTGTVQAAKQFYVNQRNVPDGTFWYKTSAREAQKHLETTVAQLGKEKYEETFTAWHAFNYDFVRNVEFKNNSIEKGLVKLIRTENYEVMRINGINPGDTGLIRRGPLESTSIFQKVSVFGSEVTTQQVPHHRIFGNYMLDRGPGQNRSSFLSDRENEFLAMLDGIKVKYAK